MGGQVGCLIVVNAVVTNYILLVVSPRYYKHWPAIGPDNYQSSSLEANYLCSTNRVSRKKGSWPI